MNGKKMARGAEATESTESSVVLWRLIDEARRAEEAAREVAEDVQRENGPKVRGDIGCWRTRGWGVRMPRGWGSV